MGEQIHTIDRRSYIKGAGAAVGTVALAGCSGGGDDHTFTVADFLPETHHIREHNLLPWVDRVEELTDGEVEFDLHFGEELGTSGEMLSLARDQVADISIVAPAYFPAELSLGQVGNLPDTYLDVEVANEAFWHLTQDFLYEEELEDLNLRPVATTAEAPYQVYAEDNPIEVLSDWEGRNVRSAGGIMSVTIEALGGSPTDIEAPEQYSAHERGVVDSNLQAEPSFLAWDIYHFFDYGTTNVNLGSWVAFWVMNHDVWDTLDETIQDAFLQAGEEIAPQTGAAYRDEEVEPLREQFQDDGIDLYEVDGDEYEEWSDAMQEAQDHWVDEIEDRGDPGQEALDMWLSYIDEYGS